MWSFISCSILSLWSSYFRLSKSWLVSVSCTVFFNSLNSSLYCWWVTFGWFLCSALPFLVLWIHVYIVLWSPQDFSWYLPFLFWWYLCLSLFLVLLRFKLSVFVSKDFSISSAVCWLVILKATLLYVQNLFWPFHPDLHSFGIDLTAGFTVRYF